MYKLHFIRVPKREEVKNDEKTILEEIIANNFSEQTKDNLLIP